jgi:hypothetical protein
VNGRGAAARPRDIYRYTKSKVIITREEALEVFGSR